MVKTKKTILSGLFAALDIVVTRFFSFMIGLTNRVSLQFLPNALCGYYLGPFYSMFSGIAADLLGMLINSGGQPYFPGFTLTAAVKGFLYGKLLYKKEPTFKRLLLTMTIVTFVIDMLLNPLWLMIMYGDGYFVLFLARLPVKLIYIPVSAFILYEVIKLLDKAPSLKKL